MQNIYRSSNLWSFYKLIESNFLLCPLWKFLQNTQWYTTHTHTHTYLYGLIDWPINVLLLINTKTRMFLLQLFGKVQITWNLSTFFYVYRERCVRPNAIHYKLCILHYCYAKLNNFHSYNQDNIYFFLRFFSLYVQQFHHCTGKKLPKNSSQIVYSNWMEKEKKMKWFCCRKIDFYCVYRHDWFSFQFNSIDLIICDHIFFSLSLSL